MGLQPPALCPSLSAVRSHPEGTDSESTVISLWLSIERGEPPKGLVGCEDDDQGTPFCGWIDFMAVINTLRTRPSPD